MERSSRDELLALSASGRHAELRRSVAAAPAAAANELIGALAERGEVAALAALDDPGLPQALRKSVRRALHALKVRGVHVPPAERVARLTPSAVGPGGELQAEAWVSLPRPAANLVLAVRSPQERRLYVALLDEEERIIDGAAYGGVSKQGVKEFLARQSADGHPFAPVAPGHVASRLRSAVRRPSSPHGDGSGKARAELAERLAFFESLADEVHPALALAPDDAGQLELGASEAAARFSAQELPFALDQPLLDRLVERLNQARLSPLVLSPTVTAGREGEVVREFVERELPAAVREGLGLRLLDRAWLRQTAGDSRAAVADASAATVLLRKPDTTAARGVLHAFVMVQLRRPDPEPGRDPDAPAEPERRSGGGLILPG